MCVGLTSESAKLPHLVRTRHVKQVMEDSGLKKNQIDEVVLVGSSTRIPKVPKLIKEAKQRKPQARASSQVSESEQGAFELNVIKSQETALVVSSHELTRGQSTRSWLKGTLLMLISGLAVYICE